ncbi:hypothetical protein [Tenacibaculum maritimum]|uniref:hypothetical protein n=1 Tax=Tenacibaculum maritimum TaxID=107401 RepID=UPI0012E4014F|nr:hypothetical protein [Tenacibaculum maritimum]MCD9563004.1 hypothetical protein [Tenacibaculum maritimum]MCD9566138.1 hypothetical protein [Tenacibaculum maritimum]MCD9579506.1 hypothetical protein [Tenacibaculum maritimum]MCD9596625.1 hypothetical protein [Tenacibaculum maritimum]MCD9613825.1 hypothetical protein [Tenacibaculum maritimum]
MKNINFILTLFASLSLIFTSCDDTGETTIADQGIKSGGVVTTLSGSSAKLLGIALNPNDLANSEVTLTDENAELLLKVTAEPGHIPSGVTKYELVKSFKDGAEVSIKESTSLPFSMEYNTVDEFLSGLNIDKKNLRIGDKINFKVKVYLNNGDIFYQTTSKNNISATINCFADLSGTYLVTNDACMPSFTTTISNNGDGTWRIESGDGGFLHLCTANATLVNWANITVVCGKVQATSDLRFGSSAGTYDIGDIKGGSWDETNGILTMEHSQSFFGFNPTWTSTYTRQ